MHNGGTPGEGERAFALSREEQIAWAAGLFEGEGSWNAYRYKTGQLQTQARLVSTDEDVVDRFAMIVGFGTIRRGIQRRPHEKPCFEWYLYRRAHVHELVRMFLPYLCVRRKARALELLALGEARPRNERMHCPNGHPYAGENLMLERINRKGKTYYARRCRECRLRQMRDRARVRNGITPDRYRR